jgi:hypothetical protein
VHRRRAVECLDLLLTGFVLELAPPIFNSLDDAVAVGCYLCPGCIGSFFRWHVGELNPIFDAVDGGLEKSLADPKDMVAQQSNGAISVVDGAVVETLVGNLPDITPRCAQYNGPLREQSLWGKRRMAGALQSDELGDVLEVLAENVLSASRQYRHGANPELEQLIFSRRIVHHVNRDEVNALLRKKLFRPQATASTRLSEQDEFVGRVFHA